MNSIISIREIYNLQKIYYSKICQINNIQSFIYTIIEHKDKIYEYFKNIDAQLICGLLRII